MISEIMEETSSTEKKAVTMKLPRIILEGDVLHGRKLNIHHSRTCSSMR